MFVNYSSAIQRQNNFSALMNSISNLDSDKMRRLELCLKARESIDQASNSSTLPISSDSELSERELQSIYAGRKQTVDLNITQLLGYQPSEADINELQNMRGTFGANFPTATLNLSQNINSVGGGISTVMQSIDSGISTGLEQFNIAQQEINNQILSVTTSIVDNVKSLIPEQTINQLQQLNPSNLDIFGNIGDLVNDLNTLITSNVENAIDNIDSALSDISLFNQQQDQTEITEKVPSNYFKSIQDLINSAFQSGSEQQLPTNQLGESLAIVPLINNNDLNQAPITESNIRE